jgi:hypothetical protein
MALGAGLDRAARDQFDQPSEHRLCLRWIGTHVTASIDAYDRAALQERQIEWNARDLSAGKAAERQARPSNVGEADEAE